MDRILLNCQINDIGNVQMWASQYIMGLNPAGKQNGTAYKTAAWTSSRYLRNCNAFEITGYINDSVHTQPFRSQCITYISPDGIKKHALVNEAEFIEDTFESVDKDKSTLKSICYINSHGISCEARLIPCDSFDAIANSSYAILVKNKEELRITDRLFIRTNKKTQEIIFNFGRPDKVKVNGKEQDGVVFTAHDDTEWRLSIAADCFCLSPKENPQYKSRINTIKFMGDALDKINNLDRKNTAMVIPVKNQL